MENRIEILQGDITNLTVDCIVNAANSSLLGGGGVDGAIHHAAGKELFNACAKLGGADAGEAKITLGYKLPANFIIHAVGPVWNGGVSNEKQLLANAYLNSMKLAVDNKCKTIAFPNISTGIYGFPKELAAPIALKTVRDFLIHNAVIRKVIFMCFEQENYSIYKNLL